MKHLLLLLLAALVVPTASAQWVFADFFPNADDAQDNVHGIGVTPDGKVWVLPYYPFSGDSVAVDPFPSADTNDCNATTGNCRVTALYVYEPDGSLASFAPLSIVTLPGGAADTLGGSASGNDWSYNSGRGLTVGPDGNVNVAFFDTMYKMDQDATVLDVVQLSPPLDNRGITGPGVDADGNIYVTGVFNVDALVKYSSSYDFIENVTNLTRGFNRAVFAFPDGNTVILPNYSSKVATIYSRPDDLTPYDSTGKAFEGMAVESITMHPTSGKIWASAGSPNDVPTGRWTDSDGNSRLYQPHTWYEFPVSEVLNNPTPVPQDSIVWNNPGDGRPRAIDFSPDGMTAYVGEFSLNTAAIQKFTFAGVSVAQGPQIDGVTLHQNTPNPFRGSTDITFELDNPSDLRVAVYDVTGREVSVLANGTYASGSHTVTFEGGDLAGGVYVFTLEVRGQQTSRRMLHLR